MEDIKDTLSISAIGGFTTFASYCSGYPSVSAYVAWGTAMALIATWVASYFIRDEDKYEDFRGRD